MNNTKKVYEDPVCKMPVFASQAYYMSFYNGKSYYFCCSSCKAKFEKDPEEYLTDSDDNHSGVSLNMNAE